MPVHDPAAKTEVLLKSLTWDNLKKLFWEELNYNREVKNLSTRDLTDKIRASLAEDPQLFASAGESEEFHVLYLRFASDKLLLTEERALINKLTKEHPYCIYIFSNRAQDLWHFTNIRLPEKEQDNDDPLKRKLIRRIVIGRDENLRTATDRISMLAVNPDAEDIFQKQSALEIQRRHDEAFDVERITKQFYDEYKAMFQILWKDLLKQTNDNRWAHDYSLQFLNRLMFVYFIQRKRWLGNDPEWLTSFWKAYRNAGLPEDGFVRLWLSDLFFCAFNNRKVFLPERKYPADVYQALSGAPYLNGGLFEENHLDKVYKHKFIISDKRFEQVIRFLNYYNFTVREDSPLDQEVAVDAEMLGKVYESLVNVSTEIDERGDAGVFYTPRVEIDLMSRLSLVDNLANNLGAEYKNAFYEFVFAMDSEERDAADRQIGELGLWEPVLQYLQGIKVVDPACGSGAFLVGMLLVLDDLIVRAEARLDKVAKVEISANAYERRKKIIMSSIYGVDVMQWAVDIAELRLWLQLVIETDIPLAELGNNPLLPKLTFKIRRGDSLVQPVPSIFDLARMIDFRFSTSFRTQRQKTEQDKEQFFKNEVSVDFSGKIEEQELNLYKMGYQEIVRDCQSRIFEIEKGLEAKEVNALGEVEHQLDEQTRCRKTKELNELKDKLQEYQGYLNFIQNNGNFFGWDKDFSEVFRKDKDGFDIVIGNPPYVRQEKIARPTEDGSIPSVAEKQKYKQELADAVYAKYAEYFKSKTIPKNSDLYIYFYYLGLSFLNKKGSFCFITSNSWLDVGYGAGFQEFLLKTTDIRLILDNNAKRSFASADINTIIALLGAPDESRNENWSRQQKAVFVSFSVPFEEIESAVVFEELEETLGRKFTQEYKVNALGYADIYQAGADSDSSDEHQINFTEEYEGDKWGSKYFRSSNVFNRILESGSNRIITLDDIAFTRRGYTTGVDKFFYLSMNDIKKWGIENEFIIPILKTAKDSQTIAFKIQDLRTYLFACDKLKRDLIGTNALRYIEWGEEQGYHSISTLINRKLWYNIGSKNPADGIILRRIGERYIVFEGNGVLENNVLFGITRKSDDIDKNVFLAILNSTITRLIIETLSSQLTGAQTVSDLNVYVIRKIPILNPLLLDDDTKDQLKFWFTKMKHRPIVAFKDEIKQEDRVESDKIILKALGLDPDDDLNDLYTAMNEIINNRISKSDSLKKKKS